ncbi:MAG: di-heme oxidoredictase family protein [Alphaproteobacteria bacterium]
MVRPPRLFILIGFLIGIVLPITAGSLVTDTRAGAANRLAAFDPAEALPGGTATSRKTFDTNAFSHASANMPFEKELDFKIGNGFFKRIWVSAPSSTTAADGLGPLYNAKSCQRCHLKDGRGHPPAANYPDDNAVSMFLRLSIPPQNDADRDRLKTRNVIGEPTYGEQLQDFSVQGVPSEGRMHIDYETFDVKLVDGETVSLLRPSYKIVDLQYGPLHPETMLSPRIAPQMIGLGLLELVPETDILALADPDDTDGDGISGKPNHVWDITEGRLRLGRFGWKAGSPGIEQQSQSAFNGDIGISTRLFPAASGECTANEKACLDAPSGASPHYENLEAHGTITDLVVFYSRNLAVPQRRDADDAVVLRGKQIFTDIGCASCHNPTFTTGPSANMPWLSRQTIWPYTDMLLHDMGDGLADNRPEAQADGREWRTPPLWGIGLTGTVNGHTRYLHDGRARSVLEAILWHGGEARASRDAAAGLTKDDRNALLKFVESL